MKEPRLSIPKDGEQSPASLRVLEHLAASLTHACGGELLGKALEAKKY